MCVWSQETSLDVEWAHAVAPDANIVIVEAKSDQVPDLLQAVDTARHLDGVSVVSMSWGLDEFPGETAYDDLFTTPAGHASVTFVAASGDTAIATGVQWPAASPNVLSVGGTTLVIDNAASGASSEAPFAGATRGASQFESQPGYQSATAPVKTRTTPDVVYNANPVPGFAVYDSSTGGGWRTVGGTSAARRSGRPCLPSLMRHAPTRDKTAWMGRRRPCLNFISITTACRMEMETRRMPAFQPPPSGHIPRCTTTAAR